MTAFPKPVRLPKTPKPLTRSSWTKRNTGSKETSLPTPSSAGSLAFPKEIKPPKPEADPADFRNQDLQAVHPDPRCFLSGQHSHGFIPAATMEYRIIDFNHILGRGPQSFSHPSRKVYSSPYNASPLIRLLHRSELVNNPYIAAYLLQRAKQAVDHAMSIGMYALREEDLAFLEIRQEWFAKNFPGQL